MVYSGDWGKLIHEKNQKPKISWHCPFKSKQPDIVSIICHRYQQHLAKLVAKLPPVLLKPVVHIDLGISPQVYEKIWNGPNGILWGWGETDSWKNQMQKILWHCPFNVISSWIPNKSICKITKQNKWEAASKRIIFVVMQCYFVHTDFFHLPMILQLRTLYCNMWQVFLIRVKIVKERNLSPVLLNGPINLLVFIDEAIQNAVSVFHLLLETFFKLTSCWPNVRPFSKKCFPLY